MRYVLSLTVALACGLVLALPFTLYEGACPAWFALAPVFGLVARAPDRRSAALLAAAFALPWVAVALSFFWHLTPVGLLAASVYTAAYYVLGLLLIRWLARAGTAAAVFGSAAVWVLIEIVRSRVPVFGFPWLLLGHTLLACVSLRQAADLLGVYGLSFLLVSVNAALAFALPRCLTAENAEHAEKREKHSFLSAFSASSAVKNGAWRVIAVVGVLVCATWLYGKLRLAQLAPRLQPGAPIAVIQGNVALKLDRSLPQMYADFQRHMELHSQVVAAARQRGEVPALVCWAETMFPTDLDKDQWAVEFRDNVRRNGVPTLTGSEKYSDDPADERDHNSANLLAADGQEIGRYYKRRLVPFGEYVPFRQTFPWLKKLQSITRDQYQPGALPSPVFDVGGYRIALNLCVEDVHPDLAREAASAGADTLVNLTNDGWFYGTFGPAAHLRAAAWRAIEVRRPLLRVTNTGHTVAVDPLGNVEVLIPPETEGVAVTRLQRVSGDPPRTWSSILGEWGCAAAMAGILAGCLWLSRSVG